MAYEDEIEQKITGSTYEECKEKLFAQYGKNFRIVNKVTDFRPGGLFYLKKKPVTIVTYVVNHQKSYSAEEPRISYSSSYSEEEQLQKNREAILQMQGSNNVMVSKKIDDMTNSIEALKKEMSQQMQQLAASTQDKHESIKKIEEMLEDNEFSFSYINMIGRATSKCFANRYSFTTLYRTQ